MTMNVLFSSVGQGSQYAHLYRTNASGLYNITPEEADQIVLALASSFAPTAVVLDHAEVAELERLIAEVDEDDNDYDAAIDAWVAWQDKAEALAAALSAALSKGA